MIWAKPSKIGQQLPGTLLLTAGHQTMQQSSATLHLYQMGA
jgi:hypothetical protein